MLRKSLRVVRMRLSETPLNLSLLIWQSDVDDGVGS